MINFYIGIRMITLLNYEGEQHCIDSLNIFKILRQDEMYKRYNTQLQNAMFKYSKKS